MTPTASSIPNLTDLGTDALEMVMINLTPKDAFASRYVCTTLYSAATSNSVWSAFTEDILEGADGFGPCAPADGVRAGAW